MGKKIRISEDELRRLYSEEKLSIVAISKKYQCSNATMQNRLHTLGIPMRSPSEEARLHNGVDIPEVELRELYLNQKLSTPEIARRRACSATTIQRRLRALGIPIRSLAETMRAYHDDKVPVSDDELRSLYVDDKLSSTEIAKRLVCNESTVWWRLHVLGVPLRSLAEAQLRRFGTWEHLRDFNGTSHEKAYLIGFRIGDLTVRKEHVDSEVVEVIGSTTRLEQIELIYRLFASYGLIHTYTHETHGYRGKALCFKLNASFEFLLDKPDHVAQWILDDDECFISFFAGLVEAEGTFSISHEKGRVPHGICAIGMADKHLLEQCRMKLIALGMRCSKLSLIQRAGHRHKQWNITTRKDYWQFQIKAKDSLLRLIELLSPHLKHAKRRADMQRVKENIEWRNSEAFREEARQRRKRIRHQDEIERE